jgi:hypothetical protein
MADGWLDVISFRQRGDAGKAYAHKIGSAKRNDKGGLNVYLDSLPLPDKDGRVSLLISPPRESAGSPRREARPATPSRFEDDEIPF